MIQQFAEKHKLKTSRDECGDLIIRGKRGHLYDDAGELCAMWTDAPPMKQARLAELGGVFWQGEVGRSSKGRRVQDAWVRGIKPEAYKLAIRMVAAKPRHAMTPARKAALEKARAAGVKRTLIGLEMVDRGIARDGYRIFNIEGSEAGFVTSGSPAPFLKKYIALAYVPVEMSEIGAEVLVEIRGQGVRAKIVPTPFYKRPKK